MAEIQPYALTSLARLKDRLTITDTTKDAALERIINGATGYIERYCNRRFKRTTYTNEIHSVHGRAQDSIALDQIPVISISAAEYRAGTPSTPNWTAFIADQYEIEGSGKSGLVRIYGGVPHGTNSVRFSYIAGYLIDFTAITDITKHTLPDELSDICERIATKLWKRREAEGKAQESFESSSVTWETLLTADDKEILDLYKRLPEFV
jgi:hypothetical protein